MHTVQFAPFSSTVSPAFWHALSSLKLDVQKLSADVIPIYGSYAAGRTIKDRSTAKPTKELELPGSVSLSETAFEDASAVPPRSVKIVGKFKNFNTIEEFKSQEKQSLFNSIVDEMWNAITSQNSTADPEEALNKFLLVTFADLKKYKYYYWFAFPAIMSKPAWAIRDEGFKPCSDKYGGDQMQAVFDALSKNGRTLPTYFLLKSAKGGKQYEIGSVNNYQSFFSDLPQKDRVVGFFDSSSSEQNPGWPLRNLLAYLAHRVFGPSHAAEFNTICWRDTEPPVKGEAWKSRVGTVSRPSTTEEMNLAVRPSASGWERTAQGKMAPRLADLAPMMDPSHLANQAVDLNLKLMKWRILPELDLDRVAATKCLLLGAGTLGCYVARTLMAWGVRNITFVDYGKVSFSNPVRQPLFEFKDSLNGGRPKAEAAAESLKRIWPGVNAEGYSFAIPMPGHPIPSEPASLLADAKADIKRLEELIDAHDAVFLLMDSRESRWLPTMLGKAKGKIVMNAALGFDSFLVMRHGARVTSDNSANEAMKLGCYYCNDVVAPSDSLSDRTLDQMCTVTRPGLASIASSNAVEVLVSLLQHPLREHAPAPPTASTSNPTGAQSRPEAVESVLGVVPHQLRGFLAGFNNVLITGQAYDRCTACSETVLKEYEARGQDMILQAVNEIDYLERLTGLDKMKAETEAMLANVDWGSDAGSADDF